MLDSVDRIAAEEAAEVEAARGLLISALVELLGLLCAGIAAYHAWGWWGLLGLFGICLRFNR